QLRNGVDDHVGRAPSLVHADLGVDPSALEVPPKLIERPGDVVLAVAYRHDKQRSSSDPLRRDAELDRLAVVDTRVEGDQDRRLLGFPSLHTITLNPAVQETLI